MISRAQDPADDLHPVLDGDAKAPSEAYAVLKETFGFDAFREGQEAVVAAVLQGRDTLCVMPTGAGKSLCYQLPALLLPGVTLVVSPLIALMRDQVDSLTRRGVKAAAINSTIPSHEQDQILDQALKGGLKLLFVAPERFRNRRFRERVTGMRISLFAVDEAHCISQWGHDFRPDYRRLNAVLEGLGHPPTLGLTATAPPEVQKDVVKQLALRDPVLLLQGLVRSNLAFDVIRTKSRESKDRTLMDIVRRPGATLVYAATRKSVDRIHERCRIEGIDVLRYHAGLDDEERSSGQDAFLTGKASLMVATNAFGMGVDRADIRRVVHYDIPRTVEAYVQETGRAGRDGEPAECTLLFNPGDLHVQRFFLDAANPTREVVLEVFRVLQDIGETHLELTADEIHARMHIDCPAPAVSAALAILDRASVVRRGRRGENLARVTVLPTAGELFSATPLPPGLSRLLGALIERFGLDRPSKLDPGKLARERGVTEETVRRGLRKLHELERIAYVPPFRGRATELKEQGEPDDLLDAIDFGFLEEKRRNEERKLDEMVGYAHSRGCRARYLLHCFGVEDQPRCGRCDLCRERTSRPVEETASSPHAQKVIRRVLEAVKAHDKRFGFRKLAGHLAGSKAEGIARGPLSRGDTYGALAHLGVKGAERWLRTAHESGLLRLAPHRLAGGRRMVHLVALAPAGLRVLKGEPMPTLDDD